MGKKSFEDGNTLQWFIDESLRMKMATLKTKTVLLKV